MSTDGTAYILNMCDQPAMVKLNWVMASQPVAPMSTAGAMPAPYAIAALSAPRVPNPQPFQQFALGSGDGDSTNALSFYLGDDVTSTRYFFISLTQADLHLGLDCQIFLFFKSAVLRFQSNARFYPAVAGTDADTDTDINTNTNQYTEA